MYTDITLIYRQVNTNKCYTTLLYYHYVITRRISSKHQIINKAVLLFPP